MYNEVAESSADQDLGSGGEMLLPGFDRLDQHVRHLVIGAGKDGNIYRRSIATRWASSIHPATARSGSR